MSPVGNKLLMRELKVEVEVKWRRLLMSAIG